MSPLVWSGATIGAYMQEVVGVEGWWIWLLTFVGTPRKMCLCAHQSITKWSRILGVV